MIAQLGQDRIKRGYVGPLLGRTYAFPHHSALAHHVQREEGLMAKAVTKLWEGLTTTGTSGTYIRPHLTGGYEFGRWHQRRWDLGYQFEKLGDRSTREACREAFASLDKAEDRRVKLLNTRKRRG